MAEDKNKLPRDICPKCGLVMPITHHNNKVALYKCKKCGGMVMVQEFDRNEVGLNVKHQ